MRIQVNLTRQELKEIQEAAKKKGLSQWRMKGPPVASLALIHAKLINKPKVKNEK